MKTMMMGARAVVIGALVVVALAGCGGDGDADTTGDQVTDAADGTDATDETTVDAAGQAFPAVCQELPLVCPDATSLANCEAGSGTAFGDCAYLPLTTGCVDVGCPSAAQLCRTADDPNGVCTHSCVDDGDCPIDGGGQGSCALVVPEAGIYTCVY